LRTFVADPGRRGLRASVAALLVFAACSAHGTRALAGPDDVEAEALINRGIELRERGKDDEALAVFKQALAKSATPRARAQVALAEQALGLWGAAESDLALALASESDAWIAKNRAALEGALAVVRRHLGSLEVRGTEGAEVFLDGVRLGALPATAPFRVEAGKRTLALRAKGFHPTARSIEVPAGGVARETVMLVALPDAASGANNGETNAGGGAARRSGDGQDFDHDPGRGQRLLGWAFAGVGGALLVTGGVGLLVRKGIVDDYNIKCPGLGATAQPADCDSKIESARTWLTVSIVSLIAGGVFAAGGVTLAVTAPRARDIASSGASGVRVGCAPSSERGGASFTCSGAF
jgi:hypothetical protein